MSDTADNFDDVEDVLASIRRLVSETSEPTKPPRSVDLEAAAQAVTSKPTAIRPAAAQPALVLTSAQRVDQGAGTINGKDETPADLAADEARINPDQSEDTDADGAMPREAFVSGRPMMLDSLRKAVSGEFQEEQRPYLTEPQGATLVSNETVARRGHDRIDAVAGQWPVRPPEDYYEDEADKDAPSETAAPADMSAGEEHEANAQAANGTDYVDDNTADSEEPESAQADSAELEHTEEADAWFDPALDPNTEAEVSESAQIHHFDPHMTVVEAGWTDDGEIIDASDIVAVGAEADDAMNEDEDDEDDAASPPGIAAFLEGDPTQTVVEDGIQDAEFADEPLVQQSADATGEGSMFSEDYDVEDEDDQPDLAAGMSSGEESALIDEETLREMVAEIVREELTGDMGERITRNVRKLVRREIHRALMTREFD